MPNDEIQEHLHSQDRRLDDLERKVASIVAQNKGIQGAIRDIRQGMRTVDETLRGKDGKNGMVSKLNTLVDERNNRQQTRWLLIGGVVTLVANVVIEVVKFLQ